MNFDVFKGRKAKQKAEKKIAEQIRSGDEKARDKAYEMFRGQVSTDRLFNPSKDGYEVSAGTSDSKPVLPSKNEKRNNLSTDYRNPVTQVFDDGTLVDPKPQSWENVARRPNRNGVPEDSTYVDMIMYDPKRNVTEASTKDGTFTYGDDDGSNFQDLENAGSKGRYVLGLGTWNG